MRCQVVEIASVGSAGNISYIAVLEGLIFYGCHTNNATMAVPVFAFRVLVMRMPRIGDQVL